MCTAGTSKPIKFGCQGKPSNHKSATSAPGLYKKCQKCEPRFLYPEYIREEKKKSSEEEMIEEDRRNK